MASPLGITNFPDASDGTPLGGVSIFEIATPESDTWRLCLDPRHLAYSRSQRLKVAVRGWLSARLPEMHAYAMRIRRKLRAFLRMPRGRLIHVCPTYAV